MRMHWVYFKVDIYFKSLLSFLDGKSSSIYLKCKLYYVWNNIKLNLLENLIKLTKYGANGMSLIVLT